MSRSYRRSICKDSGNRSRYFKKYTNKCIRQQLKDCETDGEMYGKYRKTKGKLAYDVYDWCHAIGYDYKYIKTTHTTKEIYKYSYGECEKIVLPKNEWRTWTYTSLLSYKEHL